ncbi:MAG: 1-pyrroline-5-carboxylate dehydrogenase, partial [Frondihabitans sp.]|nr:1-pyrroline-5-carboxylate dehydrogenase [Frondihabitans sp.]
RGPLACASVGRAAPGSGGVAAAGRPLVLERATQDSGLLQLGLQNTVALDRAALLAADPTSQLEGPGPSSYRALRIRLIGGDRSALARAVQGSADVAIYADEVTEAGRIELLPFLHEQAVSMTAHRFGNPVAELAALRL